MVREGNGTPLQYSCLGNSMDGGAWWAAVHGVAHSWTQLKRLSSSSSRLGHLPPLVKNSFSLVSKELYRIQLVIKQTKPSHLFLSLPMDYCSHFLYFCPESFVLESQTPCLKSVHCPTQYLKFVFTQFYIALPINLPKSIFVMPLTISVLFSHFSVAKG